MAVPERITWAVDQLDVQAGDRILEIGCGRGAAVELICQRLDGGRVLALDRSATAIETAVQRNARFVAVGSALFETVSLEDADLRETQFDKAFAINVNVFWTRSPDAELDALKRALAPSGRLFLFYEPPSASRAVDIVERVAPRLDAASFATQVTTANTSKGASLLALISHVVT